MKVIKLNYQTTFELFANGYLIIDSHKQCVVVDPGKEDPTLVSLIKEKGLTLKAILLTHGHFDHIRAVDMLVSEFHCPFYIHQNDIEYLINPHLNGSDRFSRKDVIVKNHPIFLHEGVLNILDEPIEVIETPFHSMGSVCFYLPIEKVLLSGDTLFFLSVGRTDFVGSNPKLIDSSLAKLMKLDDDVIVYPGHERETTIGNERNQNPFVKR